MKANSSEFQFMVAEVDDITPLNLHVALKNIM